MLSVIAQEIDDNNQGQSKNEKTQNATGLNFHPAESELVVQPIGNSQMDIDKEEKKGAPPDDERNTK